MFASAGETELRKIRTFHRPAVGEGIDMFLSKFENDTTTRRYSLV
jgi:hypothetical protein